MKDSQMNIAINLPCAVFVVLNTLMLYFDAFIFIQPSKILDL
jgi:hypothetical protein